MPDPSKPAEKPTLTAVNIDAFSKLKTATEPTRLLVGESRITDEHMGKIAVVCKGEAALLTALAVTDERVKGSGGG